ncbi:unnamed protein product [Owenia fusiformis]|uniref:Uncharacterized protein n=1 Tax=Owenia fusiformis TaxID=6347 RepID=A0A8J1UCG5_OWEFU|nr:unnamed protein product [Owenia fusiformis]
MLVRQLNRLLLPKGSYKRQLLYLCISPRTNNNQVNARMAYEWNKDGLDLPGLPFDTFSWTGNTNLWKACQIFESNDIPRDVMIRLHETFLMFTRSAYISFTPEYYQYIAMDFPCKISTSLVSIGKSSLVSKIELLSQKHGNKSLACATYQVVAVDKGTRKSSIIPDWLREANPESTTKPRPTMMSALEIPKDDVDVFKYEVTVVPSDTDLYGHCNQNTYIRYCTDTATVAARKEKLKDFQYDMVHYTAKDVSVIYSGECTIGAVLTVHCWEDLTDNNALFFIIKSKDETIFHCTINFYSSQPTENANKSDDLASARL